MKEATGELNMTVVTVVAIAALMAFFYMIIWPTIKTGLALNSACSASNGQEYSVESDEGTITCGNPVGECQFTDKTSNKTSTKICTQSTSGTPAS